MIMHIGCATPQTISSNSNSQPTNQNPRALSNSPRITSSVIQIIHLPRRSLLLII